MADGAPIGGGGSDDPPPDVCGKAFAGAAQMHGENERYVVPPEAELCHGEESREENAPFDHAETALGLKSA